MDTVAAVTNLQNDEVCHTCPVIGREGHRMQLRLCKPMDVGSSVKIETGDTLSLGEVSYCDRDGEGYVVWVEVLEALHNVQELSRLARALLA